MYVGPFLFFDFFFCNGIIHGSMVFGSECLQDQDLFVCSEISLFKIVAVGHVKYLLAILLHPTVSFGLVFKLLF